MTSRYFELIEGASNKFWEIWLEGTEVRTRYGKIGAAGQTTVKHEGSAAAALKLHDKLVREKTGKGYAEKAATAPTPQLGAANPDIEAAIARDLDDPGNYLVYADWLTSRADPLGELIVLQHQAASEANEAKAHELRQSADALIEKHALLGTMRSFAGGDGKRMQLDWHVGFVRGVKMSWAELSTSPLEAAKELAALLELPVARFVRVLSLESFAREEVSSFKTLLEVLAAKRPAHLQELFVGSATVFPSEISMTATGDFAAAAKELKTLKKVTLRARKIGLGSDLELPELTELTLETGSLTKANLSDLCAIKAPKLERLNIWFGARVHGSSSRLKDLAPILAADGLPNLKHLGIMNCEFVNAVAAALPAANVLEQLNSLDLSMGCLRDESIDAMIESGAFRHLEMLNLEDNALTHHSKEKVGALARNVRFGKQNLDRNDDEKYQLCSVGEP